MSLENRFVPKVHPATRAVEPDDPYILNATPVEGDPEVMLRCVVEDYGWMGWDAGRILALFHDPGYPTLNALLDYYGEEGIRERIAQALHPYSAFQVRVEMTDAEDDPDEEHDEPLIELGIPAWGPDKPQAGGNHATGL